MSYKVNTAINNTKIHGAAIQGIKIYSAGPPPTYIAEGSSIYKNNNGTKGSLITTITKNDWTTLSLYAPYIEIALADVCRGWTGVGVPLNFAILKSTGNHFMYDTKEFNQPIEFPMLENLNTTCSYFMSNCYAFNQNLVFQKAIRFGSAFMVGADVFAKKITFAKFIITSSATSFLVSGYANRPLITLEFKTPQTAASLHNSFCYMRPDNTTNHSTVDLRIHKDSLNVNVANKTWAGHTFRSITLI